MLREVSWYRRKLLWSDIYRVRTMFTLRWSYSGWTRHLSVTEMIPKIGRKQFFVSNVSFSEARTEREKAEIPLLQNLHNDVPTKVFNQEEKVRTVPLNRRQMNSFLNLLETKTEWNDISKRVDLISRALFPVLFFVFNILYWSRFGQQNVLF